MFGFSLVGLDIKEAGVEDIEEPQSGPEVARSKCYALLASGFSVPDKERFEQLSGGELAEMLDEQLAELPYQFDFALEPLPSEWSREDYEAEFLRLFEVGPGGPPCPLFGGVWSADRMKSMEEVMRFYKYFGLKLSDERRVPPDHLTTELEFLHYLTFRQAAAKLDAMAQSYRRAQLDFIERQPGRWVPKLEERLGEVEAPPFFSGLVGTTARFLATDYGYLTADSGTPATAQTKQ